MIWLFLILGVSTLLVLCVAIVLYMRLRLHLKRSHVAQDSTLKNAEPEHRPDTL